MCVLNSWRNLERRLFVSSLCSLSLIFFRNCWEPVKYWHLFRTRVERAQARPWSIQNNIHEPSVGRVSGQNCPCHHETHFVWDFSWTDEGRQNIPTCPGQDSNELRRNYGGYTIKRVSHQLAEFQDKIVRVIAKQSLFDLFLLLSRAGKNLALVKDNSRTSSGRNIGKITIKHASHQLAQCQDKVVRVTFLIMFDPLCILFSFILFYLLLFRWRGRVKGIETRK